MRPPRQGTYLHPVSASDSPSTPAPAPPPCIGVFDSGLGGLSVLREIHARLPHIPLHYIADSAWCPYGGREPEEIRRRAHALATHLVARHAHMLVVACNTATMAAIDSLRTEFTLPIIGMEPAVKPAAAHTRSGVIGVLATGAALAGEKFHQLVTRHAASVKVVTRPCPGLVERVESGDLGSPDLLADLESHTRHLLGAGADVIVLGCIHYPFLRPALSRILPADITIIDTGSAVARQVENRLSEAPALIATQAPPAADSPPIDLHIETTGDPPHIQTLAPKLWPATAAAKFSGL